MEIYCKATSLGLVPLDDNERAQYNQLRPGCDVRVTITMPRNIRFHRKFFALLNIVLDNLPESLQSQRHISSVESLLSAIKIDMGYFEIVNIDGRNVIKLKSISFAKMDEAAFSRFYDLAVDDILKNYLCGTDCNSLLHEVEEFTNNQL